MFRITDGKGFHITFENGWTVSVQWGYGNYGDHYIAHGLSSEKVGAVGSTTAEIWAWNSGGKHISSNPEGYQTPAQVLAYMTRVAAMEA